MNRKDIDLLAEQYNSMHEQMGEETYGVFDELEVFLNRAELSDQDRARLQSIIDDCWKIDDYLLDPANSDENGLTDTSLIRQKLSTEDF